MDAAVLEQPSEPIANVRRFTQFLIFVPLIKLWSLIYMIQPFHLHVFLFCFLPFLNWITTINK